MITRTFSLALALVVLAATQLYAVPTKVIHQDAPVCDPLFIPDEVDEIGDPAFGFPPDEQLAHAATITQQPVCLPTDDPAMPEALVVITNLTGRDLTEVWYIASNETRISNVDGFANDASFLISDSFDNEAFRIDNDASDPGGSHHPLVFESGLVDGIWGAGETWHFILQDYGNALGLPPDAFVSIGVGDASTGGAAGIPASSGSIIAIPQIPEPSTALLALFGVAVIGIGTRRNRE